MLHFESDYIAGAHPKILEKLAESNFEMLSGYGDDKYTKSAKEKISSLCGGEVELLTGGTQTNAIVIATMLSDWEGVISATTGHIFGHEAGAVEYTGKKVIPLPAKEGKINPGDLERLMENFNADPSREHTVFPKMVYISYPTEYGTLYSKEELTKIRSLCDRFGLILFADGARLGYGLMSSECDLTLKEFASLCDVFYIGGTKVGALCGEAVVFTKGNRPAHFFNSVKKRGALIAKGRLLGIQFDTLFTNRLYFEISQHAINMAEKLKEILARKGFTFYLNSPTNQQFVIMDNDYLEKLQQKVVVSVWDRLDDRRSVVRFATSWSTTEQDLKDLESLL